MTKKQYKKKLSDDILEMLKKENLTTRQISDRFKISYKSVGGIMGSFNKKGLIQTYTRGTITISHSLHSYVNGEGRMTISNSYYEYIGQ